MKFNKFFFLLCFILPAICSFNNVLAQIGQKKVIRNKIDWASFLSRHDMIWKLPPTFPEDAGILKNQLYKILII